MIDFEKHLRLTQALTHVGSWEWDVATDRLTWSDEHYRIFGVTPETFTPTFEGILERIHPGDVPTLRAAAAQCQATRAPFTCEYRVLGAGGTVTPVHARGAWDGSAGGGAARLYGTAQDLTESRRSADALLHATRRAHKLAGRALEVQETERRCIARELHDEVGQCLTAVQMSLQRVRRRTRAPVVGGGIDECLAMAGRALDQVRSMSLNLRPPQLDDLGLEAALGWLLEQHCASASLRHSLAAVGVPRALPPDVEIACFRVVQEAVTNIVRHAQAQTVEVRLRCEAGTVEVSVEDDGCGFDVEAARARAAVGCSMGLGTMEERALLAGGGLTIRRRAPAGTRVAAYFPLLKAPEPDAPVR
jgi:two-component system sensor histidine kinase UhpB